MDSSLQAIIIFVVETLKSMELGISGDEYMNEDTYRAQIQVGSEILEERKTNKVQGREYEMLDETQPEQINSKYVRYVLEFGQGARHRNCLQTKS
jgi:hypothetical protein